MTNSSRRDSVRNDDIAAISTANGRMRSTICGTRYSDALAINSADA